MLKNSYICTKISKMMNFIRGHEPTKTMDTGINHAIVDWLREMKISSYKINESQNFVISTISKVDISNYIIEELPSYITFSRVYGGFYCSNTQLKSLRGIPRIIQNGSFVCANNLLENLVNSPESVDGYYVVSNNKLTSLEGLSKTITGTIAIDNNSLTSLQGSPSVVFGDFYCQHNPLKNLEYLPSKIHGTLYISYTEDFLKKHKKPHPELGRLFIEKIQKQCSISEEIKIM